MRIAKVKTESSQNEVLVAITSEEKPQISEEFQNKWQKIVDLAAKIIGVPSGLITKLNENTLEVFLTSKTEANIFQQNLKLDLGLGWYCENVAGTRSEFIVTNALKKDNWKENPSVPFNMISYMGLPILWPDGEVFGTFCMLDNKENLYPPLFFELLTSLREIIQNDLQSILLYEQAKNDVIRKDCQLRDIHHSVKNHFNLLISTLSLQSAKDRDNDKLKTILSDIQSRISAISLIHDKLYLTINPDKISLGEYLTELGKYIIKNLSKYDVKYICSSPQINGLIKTSLPCGLILNELITNSLKYAFENVASPEINLIIEQSDGDEIIFTYKDNGVGLPADFDLNNLKSLGMILVRQSVLQLNGKFSVSNENGFQFRMTFKKPVGWCEKAKLGLSEVA